MLQALPKDGTKVTKLVKNIVPNTDMWVEAEK